MTKPTLTIGIPTRNRSNLISELLDDIFSQLTDDTRPRVKVLIVDNASDISYEAVADKYSRLYPEGISYMRNNENIGFSANVNMSVCSADSDFVMIMSDDDGLSPYTIDTVLAMLDAHPDIGVGMLAHSTYDKKMTMEVRAFSPSISGYFANGKDFLDKIPSFPDALISGYVVNRSLWMENFLPDFTTINSIHFIMGPLLIAKYPCFALGDRGYVKYREGMGQWSIATDPLFPFPMFESYLKSCQINKESLGLSAHEKLYCSTMRTAMGFTIRNKVLGYKFPRKEIMSLLLPYFDSSTFRIRLSNIMLRLLSRVPRWLLYVPFRWLVPEEL